jgi:enolase
MINIVNGGAHADNPLDFQEFMIMPVGAATFAEAVRMGAEVFHTLKEDLKRAGHAVNVGDEGGFAPALRTAPEALDFIMGAIARAGLRPGDDVAIALDPAASELYDQGVYRYAGEGRARSRQEQAEYLAKLVNAYPIVSIEDGMAENDPEGWRMLGAALGSACRLVGDDVFCTNPVLFREGIAQDIGNAILVKINQIGTLTETWEVLRIAAHAGYGVVMSHRSGETEDTSVADLAVAANCGLIKTGSMSRSDRTAKYNRLLRIERELGSGAIYAGSSIAAG